MNMNMKKLFVLSLLLSIILTISIAFYLTQSENDKDITALGRIDMQFSKLEVMRTRQEQEQGLQNRTELCNTCGMIFVWDNDQILNFWMKNTLVPIDIIYLDKDNKVVTIIKRPKLNTEDNTYSSIYPVRKALEIPTIRSDELKIQVGDILLFDY
jgi:uncharacterized protein